jgi:hypothetical protein
MNNTIIRFFVKYIIIIKYIKMGYIEYSNGDRYNGDIISGEKHGKGHMKYSNGSVYYGDWKHDKRDGRGLFIDGDGQLNNENDNYDGHWYADMKHGRGFYMYATGNWFSGDWFNDMRHGSGLMVYAQRVPGPLRYINVECYDGQWYADMRHGQGCMLYCDGHNFTGIWNNDQPTDDGTTSYLDTSNENENELLTRNPTNEKSNKKYCIVM